MKKALTALLTLCVLAIAAPAFAQTPCEELTTAQKLVGYITLMGIVYTLGIGAIGVGFCIFFGGFILTAGEALWQLIKGIADIIGYALSIALVVAGSYVSEASALVPVLTGCILFAGSIMLSIHVRELKGKNPIGIYAALSIFWGATAVYYGMPQVGFLAVGAIMGVLGYSVIVTPLSYGFGFRNEETLARGTFAALILLGFYMLERAVVVGVPPPAWIKVLEGGVFWLGSLVGFTGLLVMSFRGYVSDTMSSYPAMQVTAFAILFGSMAFGLVYGINPLAGMAGTFLVFFVATKVFDVTVRSAMGLGFRIMVVGGLMYGAYQIAMAHEEVVFKYLTATLPV